MIRTSSCLAIVVLWLGCTSQKVPKTTCHDEMLGVADPWTCTVSAESLDAPSSVTFSTESRNQVAQVTVSLAVTKGTLRLGYFDVQGEQHVVLSPESPLALEMKAPLRRDRRSFTVSFDPQGRVEGLSGTVKYSTP